MVAGSPPAATLGQVDVVLPILHGPFGEDGTVQGLLELAGVPYVGAGVAASALCMDKDLFKAVLRDRGIPVARNVTLRDGDTAEHPFAYPVFVKPARLGSSVGISKVHDESELGPAVELAREHDDKVLVEEGVPGVEVECGVLGNRDPIASVVGEIVAHAEWYDFSAKYDEGGMDLVVPARIPREADERVRELAIQSFVATECEGMARIDFFVRPDGEVVVNEINTIPGFTSTSVYAKLFEEAGVPYAELLDRLIALALERHERRSRLRVLGAAEQTLRSVRDATRARGSRTARRRAQAARRRVARRPGLGERKAPRSSPAARARVRPLDPVVLAERDEGVHARREDAGPPDERALDRKLDEGLQRAPVAALECDPEPCAAEIRLVALAGEPSPSRSSSALRASSPEAEVREAAQQKVAWVADARRGEIRVDRGQRAIRLGGEPRPVAQRVGQLELERDRVDAMVGGQALREAAVELCETSRLVEAAHRGGRRASRPRRPRTGDPGRRSPTAARAAPR